MLAQLPLTGEDGDRTRLVVEGEVMEVGERVISVANVAVEILVAEKGNGRRKIIAPPVTRLILREGSGRAEDGGSGQCDNGAQG